MLKISMLMATVKTPALNGTTRPLLTGQDYPLPDAPSLPAPGGGGKCVQLAGSPQDAEVSGFHPGDGDAKRYEQQLNRDRCGQGPTRLDRWKLLAHQQRDRQ